MLFVKQKKELNNFFRGKGSDPALFRQFPGLITAKIT
jgi:hypothetical protein